MGLKKLLLYGGGLVVALAGPISLFTTSDMLAGVKQRWFSRPAASASAKPGSAAAAGAGYGAYANQVPAAISATAGSSTTILPTPSIAEAINFDVTIDGVLRRWPRVSTGLAEVQLQGYRVPLVTGTAASDLAGSLTYYFNNRQQVGRITFHGVTGDAGPLVALLTSRYQFTRRLTNDPGLILYEAVNTDNRSVGQARIRSSSVVSASQPHSRFTVDLTIDRPG